MRDHKEIKYDVCLLELVTPETFCTKSTFTKENVDQTSAILLCNNKLLELATKRCTSTSTLYITYSGSLDIPSPNIPGNSTTLFSAELTVRQQLSTVYNQLWDFCLTQQQLGLDCRVLLTDKVTGTTLHSNFKTKEQVIKEQRVQTILNAGPNIDSAATLDSSSSSSSSNVIRNLAVEVVNLESELQEEVAGEPYILFNQPGICGTASELPRFRRVVLGGTFDHFHNGHKALLSVAMLLATKSNRIDESGSEVPNEIVIGITGDNLPMLANKTSKKYIQSLDVRRANLENFMHSIALFCKVRIVEISDAFGPTVDEKEEEIEGGGLEALVVSSETLKGARLVNEERKRKGMKPLVVVVVMRSNTHTLSSTFVRNRELELQLQKDAVGSGSSDKSSSQASNRNSKFESTYRIKKVTSWVANKVSRNKKHDK